MLDVGRHRSPRALAAEPAVLCGTVPEARLAKRAVSDDLSHHLDDWCLQRFEGTTHRTRHELPSKKLAGR